MKVFDILGFIAELPAIERDLHASGPKIIEEACKIVPLFVLYQYKKSITWRTAVMWGLASGVGFGVNEGILYSETFYNGITPAMQYVVRFVSCVALHAIWSASAGVRHGRP